MARLTGFLTRLRRAFHRRATEAQLLAEMNDHLDRETARRIALGEDPATARRRAGAAFGSFDARAEEVRDRRIGHRLFDLVQAAGFALRRLRRAPVFTLTAVATLALCIGANTTVFTYLDGLVLRPLPFPEPDRLVTVLNSYPGAGYPRAAPSIPDYFARREAVPAFASVSLFAPVRATIGEPGALRRVEVGRVTPEFFATLGVQLVLGASFTDAELTYQTAAVAVLTDELWRTQFGADPNIVGQTLVADGLPNTIIGVLPRGFRFLSSQAQFFKPLAHQPNERSAANRHHTLPGMIMLARLAPGATVAEAQAQLDVVNLREAAHDPQAAQLENWGYHSLVRPLHADFVREIRPVLLLLQAGVLLLLLIGAVNLTHLLLVRLSGRGREVAVRQALGARRAHLARDLLLETTLLAVGGGLLGLGLGAGGVQLLATLGADRLPLGASITFDVRVAAIALATALLVGGLLALVPIAFLRRIPPAARLQIDTAGATAGRTSQRLRQSFGMLQIALAFVLLCGAGLLAASLQRIRAQPLGFDAEHVLTGTIELSWKNYRDAASQVAFADRLIDAVTDLPGVSHAAVNNSLPFSGFTAGSPVALEGRARDASVAVRAHHRAGVTSDYWRTMGIPLLRGRLPDDAEIARGGPPVCVIDQALAEMYWPGGDAIGSRLCLGSTFDATRALTIIGVVGTTKQKELTETAPMGMIYSPFSHFSTGWFRVVLRTGLPPAAMAEELRRAVHRLDPELVLSDVRPMGQLIEQSLLARRSPALLAAGFAAAALLLATVGTYGTLAYTVSHRRREIGVRMALGALPSRILRQFLAMGARLLVGGCVLGVLGVWLAGGFLRPFLFDVAPFSPAVVAAVAVILAVVVLIAIALPALRAAAVDPAETVRHE